LLADETMACLAVDGTTISSLDEWKILFSFPASG
jgi:hypothetical protein